MRHRVSGRKLSRDMDHRKALRRNLVSDLLTHEKIVTTEAKARMLRPTVERIITLAKRGIVQGKANPQDEVHARRVVSARVARSREGIDQDGDKQEIDVVRKLFNEIAPRYIERPGGYTRIVKLGRRPGDNAKMAVIMLVEENAGTSNA